jgi:opacity protein-like surface antigen
MKRYLPVLLVIFSGALWAQSGELWFSAGESILSNRNLGTPLAVGGLPSDVQLDNGFRFGFRFAFNTGGHMGHEIQYAYNRTHFVDNTGAIFGAVSKPGMAIHQGGYNFLFYATPEGTRIRPFATGGVHFANFVPPGSSAGYGGGSTKFGFNYGAGVKVKVSSLFGIRFDLREYETGKPDFGGILRHQSGLLRQTEVSAGFGVLF